MNAKIFASILGLSLAASSLFAQNRPSEKLIDQAAKSVIATKFESNELSDYQRYQDEAIEYFSGNFSGKNREECLVAYPMLRETGTAGAYQKFIMLFYKKADGTWAKGNFSAIEQDLELRDLDNDKLQELICHSGFTWMGETHDKMHIYQLKGDQETLLYENESEEYLLFLEVGRVASKNYEVKFVDTNKDGILELQEDLTTGTVVKIVDDEPTLDEKKSSRVLHLKNNKYQ